MPIRYVTTRDQQALTVNALVQSPLNLPERIISFLENQFVTDRVLRNAGEATGGAVSFRKSSTQFADQGVEIVNEGAEIPLATVTRGDLDSARVLKRALGVGITREMIDRNATGEVERQLTALRNTMVRDIDGALFTTLSAAVTQSVAATNPWSSASATIRKNINAAKLLVRKAVAPGATAKDYLGFRPTHLLLSVDSEADLLNSSEFLNMIRGSANAQNVSSVADIGPILGLQPLVSIGLAAGTAWVVEANTVGGYADEYPLQATELYEKRENELWRSDCKRSTAGFIDQPLAAAKITSV